MKNEIAPTAQHLSGCGAVLCPVLVSTIQGQGWIEEGPKEGHKDVQRAVEPVP